MTQDTNQGFAERKTFLISTLFYKMIKIPEIFDKEGVCCSACPALAAPQRRWTNSNNSLRRFCDHRHNLPLRNSDNPTMRSLSQWKYENSSDSDSGRHGRGYFRLAPGARGFAAGRARRGFRNGAGPGAGQTVAGGRSRRRDAPRA